MLGELVVPLASAAVQEQDVVRLGISNYATPTPHEVLYTRTIETWGGARNLDLKVQAL